MRKNPLNPYQPVALQSAVIRDDDAQQVSFRLTASLLRHAESRYLLHWHSSRLLIGSLAMIAASCIAFTWALFRGAGVFTVTLVAMMTAATLIYLALVHHAKLRIRGLQRSHGLVPGAVCSVNLDDSQLHLTSPSGNFRWPGKSLRVYRTRKGMLLCPAPLLFIFVPNINDSSGEAYDQLQGRLKAM